MQSNLTISVCGRHGSPGGDNIGRLSFLSYLGFDQLNLIDRPTVAPGLRVVLSVK